MNSAQSTIMSSLSALPSPHLSRLTLYLSAVLHRRLRRLSTILSSTALFSLTLRRLHSLSLRQKSILIARFLLSDLALLNHLIYDAAPSRPSSSELRLRDLDAALLLLLLCEIDRHEPELLDSPLTRWRAALRGYVGASIFQISRLGGFSTGGALLEFVDCVGRCWNLVDAMCGGGKEEEEAAAASSEAVAALPSVAAGGGAECAICREEMAEGREACELPCRHVFHWPCVLRWLGKRNTCPCCRRRLPANDLRRRIERLLEELTEIIGGEPPGGGD